MPPALNACPKSKKSPNLVTLLPTKVDGKNFSAVIALMRVRLDFGKNVPTLNETLAVLDFY